MGGGTPDWWPALFGEKAAFLRTFLSRPHSLYEIATGSQPVAGEPTQTQSLTLFITPDTELMMNSTILHSTMRLLSQWV